MLGIKIQDKKLSNNGGSFLSFDLKDIFAVIGEPVRHSQWRCYDLCYTAKKEDTFNEFRETRFKLSGEEVINFASRIHQTIDGRFEATSKGAAKNPWLIIVAFDSSWFEIWSSQPKIIERLKQHFEKVCDITST
jgi:hypothetical protein